jgi:anti-sigma factor RsiW
MQCSDAQDRLSAFHDGELPAEQAVAMEGHLAGCESCRRDLDAIRMMSDMAAGLRGLSQVPSWRAMEPRILPAVDQTTMAASKLNRRRRRLVAGAASAAAILVLLIGWLIRPGDDHVAVDFDQFLTRYEQDIDAAQSVLLSNYSGQPIAVDAAADVLKYQPVVAHSEPDSRGYSLYRAYLLRMPCCTCLEAVYRRNDGGGYLCVFEHEGDQPIWFGNRPAITATIQGRPARLVQVDGALAASWPVGKRQVTVIGAASLEELADLVATLRPSDQG